MAGGEGGGGGRRGGACLALWKEVEGVGVGVVEEQGQVEPGLGGAGRGAGDAWRVRPISALTPW